MPQVLIDLALPFLEKAAREEIKNSGTIHLYKKNDIILLKNEEINHAFFILSGLVKVFRHDARNAEFVMFYLYTGHSFAVSVSSDSSLQNKTSFLSFKASENTYILKLPLDDKDRLAKKYDSFYKYILSTAVMHYGFYNDLISSMAFEQLDVRIEYFLKRLAKAKNKSTLKITHQEIANSLNSSRETVSRLMKQLEAAQKIKMGHNTVELLNLSL
jgi:CRP/FNR family transcriptional regulator, anaerobic regulatory protein